MTKKNTTYADFRKGVESENPEVAANVMIALINITSYLLKQQIDTLENEFLAEGDLKEQMSKARIEVLKKLK